MSQFNAQFGDLGFGDGLFAATTISSDSITWIKNCSVLSDWSDIPSREDTWGNEVVAVPLWNNELPNAAAWNNQEAAVDNWNKIPSDIIRSTPCRRI